MTNRVYSKRGGCATMLAAATAFALISKAPPGGPEGLMGLGAQLAWLGRMLVVGIVAGPIGAAVIGRLRRVMPPPLDAEIERGTWREHSVRAYGAGLIGAVFGGAVFGLATFPVAALAVAFVAPDAAFAAGMTMAIGAGAFGAAWCGRRALWTVTVAKQEQAPPRP